MLKLQLLALELLFLSFFVLNSQLLKRIIISFIVVELFLVEVHDLITSDIQKLSGMGHDHDCALTVGNVVLEPHDGVEVEMVCGLVKEKNVGLDEKGSGQGHSHTPTSGK